jgi:hypothetical protein
MDGGMLKRRAPYLLTLALALADTAPVAAQTDPFQSVPGPAPIVKKPVPTRPAAHPQRPLNRRDARPDAAATLSPPASAAPQSGVPIVAAPQPVPPPAAELPSLAGTWTGGTNCPLATPEWDINLAPVAREQYSVTSTQDSSLTGWVSGKLVHMQWTGRLGETGIDDGTVTSPTSMRGKSHRALGITCDWWAKKG